MSDGVSEVKQVRPSRVYDFRATKGGGQVDQVVYGIADGVKFSKAHRSEYFGQIARHEELGNKQFVVIKKRLEGGVEYTYQDGGVYNHRLLVRTNDQIKRTFLVQNPKHFQDEEVLSKLVDALSSFKVDQETSYFLEEIDDALFAVREAGTRQDAPPDFYVHKHTEGDRTLFFMSQTDQPLAQLSHIAQAEGEFLPDGHLIKIEEVKDDGAVRYAFLDQKDVAEHVVLRKDNVTYCLAPGHRLDRLEGWVSKRPTDDAEYIVRWTEDNKHVIYAPGASKPLSYWYGDHEIALEAPDTANLAQVLRACRQVLQHNQVKNTITLTGFFEDNFLFKVDGGQELCLVPIKEDENTFALQLAPRHAARWPDFFSAIKTIEGKELVSGRIDILQASAIGFTYKMGREKVSVREMTHEGTTFFFHEGRPREDLCTKIAQVESHRSGKEVLVRVDANSYQINGGDRLEIVEVPLKRNTCLLVGKPDSLPTPAERQTWAHKNLGGVYPYPEKGATIYLKDDGSIDYWINQKRPDQLVFFLEETGGYWGTTRSAYTISVDKDVVWKSDEQCSKALHDARSQKSSCAINALDENTVCVANNSIIYQLDDQRVVHIHTSAQLWKNEERGPRLLKEMVKHFSPISEDVLKRPMRLTDDSLNIFGYKMPAIYTHKGAFIFTETLHEDFTERYSDTLFRGAFFDAHNVVAGKSYELHYEQGLFSCVEIAQHPDVEDVEAAKAETKSTETTACKVHNVSMKTFEQIESTNACIAFFKALFSLLSYPFVALYNLIMNPHEEAHTFATMVAPTDQERRARINQETMIAQLGFLRSMLRDMDPVKKGDEDPKSALQLVADIIGRAEETALLFEKSRASGKAAKMAKAIATVVAQLQNMSSASHAEIDQFILPLGIGEGKEYLSHFLIFETQDDGSILLKDVCLSSPTLDKGTKQVVKTYDATASFVSENTLSSLVTTLFHMNSYISKEHAEEKDRKGPFVANSTLDQILCDATFATAIDIQETTQKSASTDPVKAMFTIVEALGGPAAPGDKLEDLQSSKARFYLSWSNHLIEFYNEQSKHLNKEECTRVLENIKFYTERVRDYMAQEIGLDPALAITENILNTVSEKLVDKLAAQKLEDEAISNLNSKANPTKINILENIHEKRLEAKQLSANEVDTSRVTFEDIEKMQEAIRPLRASDAAFMASLDKRLESLKNLEKIVKNATTRYLDSEDAEPKAGKLFFAELLKNLPLEFNANNQTIWETMTKKELGRWGTLLSKVSERLMESALRSGDFPLHFDELLEMNLVLPIVLRQIMQRRTELEFNAFEIVIGEKAADKGICEKVKVRRQELIYEREDEIIAEAEEQHADDWKRQVEDREWEISQWHENDKQYRSELARYNRSNGKDRWGYDLSQPFNGNQGQPNPPAPLTEQERLESLRDAVEDALRGDLYLNELQRFGQRQGFQIQQLLRTVAIENQQVVTHRVEDTTVQIGQNLERQYIPEGHTDRMLIALGEFAKIMDLKETGLAYWFAHHQGLDQHVGFDENANPLMLRDFSIFVGEDPILGSRYATAKKIYDRHFAQAFAPGYDRQDNICPFLVGYRGAPSYKDFEKDTEQVMELKATIAGRAKGVSERGEAIETLQMEEHCHLRRHQFVVDALENPHAALERFLQTDSFAGLLRSGLQALTTPKPEDNDAFRQEFMKMKRIELKAKTTLDVYLLDRYARQRSACIETGNRQKDLGDVSVQDVAVQAGRGVKDANIDHVFTEAASGNDQAMQKVDKFMLVQTALGETDPVSRDRRGHGFSHLGIKESILYEMHHIDRLRDESVRHVLLSRLCQRTLIRTLLIRDPDFVTNLEILGEMATKMRRESESDIEVFLLEFAMLLRLQATQLADELHEAYTNGSSTSYLNRYIDQDTERLDVNELIAKIRAAAESTALPSYDADDILSLYRAHLPTTKQKLYATHLLHYFRYDPPEFNPENPEVWARHVNTILRAYGIVLQSPLRRGHVGLQRELMAHIQVNFLPEVTRRFQESEQARNLVLNQLAGNSDETIPWKPTPVSYIYECQQEGRKRQIDLRTCKGIDVKIRLGERGYLPREVRTSDAYTKVFGSLNPIVDSTISDRESDRGVKLFKWTDTTHDVMYEILLDDSKNVPNIQIFQTFGRDLQRFQFREITVDNSVANNAMKFFSRSSNRTVEELINKRGIWENTANQNDLRVAQSGRDLQKDAITLHISGKKIKRATLDGKIICSGLKSRTAKLLGCRDGHGLVLLSTSGSRIDEIRFPKQRGVANQLILMRSESDNDVWLVKGRPGWQVQLRDTTEIERKFGANYRKYMLPLHNPKSGEYELIVWPYVPMGSGKRGGEITFLSSLEDYFDAMGKKFEDLELGEGTVAAQDFRGLAGLATGVMGGMGELVDGAASAGMDGLLSGIARGMFCPPPFIYHHGASDACTHAGFYYLAFVASKQQDYATAAHFIDLMSQEGVSTRADAKQFEKMVRTFFMIETGISAGNQLDFDPQGGGAAETLASLKKAIGTLIKVDNPIECAFKLKQLLGVFQLKKRLNAQFPREKNNPTDETFSHVLFPDQGMDTAALTLTALSLYMSYCDGVAEHTKELKEAGLFLSEEELSAIQPCFLMLPLHLRNIPEPILQMVLPEGFHQYIDQLANLSPEILGQLYKSQHLMSAGSKTLSLLSLGGEEGTQRIEFAVPTPEEVFALNEKLATNIDPHELTMAELHNLQGSVPKSATVIAHFWDYVDWIAHNDLKIENLSYLCAQPRPYTKDFAQVDTARRMLLLVYHFVHHSPDESVPQWLSDIEDVRAVRREFPDFAAKMKALAKQRYKMNYQSFSLPQKLMNMARFYWKQTKLEIDRHMYLQGIPVDVGPRVLPNHGPGNTYASRSQFFMNHHVLDGLRGRMGDQVITQKGFDLATPEPTGVPDLALPETLLTELLNFMDQRTLGALAPIIERMRSMKSPALEQLLQDFFREPVVAENVDALMRRPEIRLVTLAGINMPDLIKTITILCFEAGPGLVPGVLDAATNLMPDNVFNAAPNPMQELLAGISPHLIEYATRYQAIAYPKSVISEAHYLKDIKVEGVVANEKIDWRERFFIDRTDQWEGRWDTHADKALKYFQDGREGETPAEKHLNKRFREGIELARDNYKREQSDIMQVQRFEAMAKTVIKREREMRKYTAGVRVQILEFARENAQVLGLLPAFSAHKEVSEEQIITRVLELYSEGKLGVFGKRDYQIEMQKEFAEQVTDFLLSATETQQLVKAKGLCKQLYLQLKVLVKRSSNGKTETVQAKANEDENWKLKSRELLHLLERGSDRLRYAEENNSGDKVLKRFAICEGLSRRYLVKDYQAGWVSREKATDAVEAIMGINPEDPDLSLDEANPDRFVKVRMGIGKTSFIFPLLAKTFLENGRNPILMTTPDLVLQLQQQLDKRAFRFEFNINFGLPLQDVVPQRRGDGTRAASESQGAYIQRVSQHLSYMAKTLEDLHKTERYVVTTPSDLAAVRNKRIQLQDQLRGMEAMTPDQAKEHFKQIQLLKRIEHYFRSDSGVYLWDEDVNMDVRFDFNFATGNTDRVDSHRLGMIEIIMNTIFTSKTPKIKHFKELLFQGNLRALQDVETTLEQLAKEIYRSALTLEVIKGWHALGQQDQNEKEFIDYVMGRTEQVPHHLGDWVKGEDDELQLHRVYASVMKTFFSQTFASVLPTHPKLQRGIGANGLMTVPYHDGEIKENVQYGNECELILHHICHYAAPGAGISEGAFMYLFRNEFCKGMRDMPISSHFPEEKWREWTARIEDIVGHSGYKSNYDAFINSPELGRQRVQFLTYIMKSTPHIEVYREQISCNAQHIPTKNHGGSSGTGSAFAVNVAKPALNGEIDCSEKPADISGETMISIDMDAKTESFSDALEHVIKAAKTDSNCRAILNCEYEMRGGRMDRLATKLHGELPERQLIFRNQFKEKMIWHIGADSAVAYEASAIDPDRCLFLYGPADGRGVDFAIPKGGAIYGLALVGLTTDTDTFDQLVWRQRQLGRGQDLRIAYDTKMEARIRDPKLHLLETNESIRIGHVLKYIELKTLQTSKVKHTKAAIRNISFGLVKRVDSLLTTPFNLEAHDENRQMDLINFERGVVQCFRELYIQNDAIKWESEYMPTTLVDCIDHLISCCADHEKQIDKIGEALNAFLEGQRVEQRPWIESLPESFRTQAQQLIDDLQEALGLAKAENADLKNRLEGDETTIAFYRKNLPPEISRSAGNSDNEALVEQQQEQEQQVEQEQQQSLSVGTLGGTQRSLDYGNILGSTAMDLTGYRRSRRGRREKVYLADFGTFAPLYQANYDGRSDRPEAVERLIGTADEARAFISRRAMRFFKPDGQSALKLKTVTNGEDVQSRGFKEVPLVDIMVVEDNAGRFSTCLLAKTDWEGTIEHGIRQSRIGKDGQKVAIYPLSSHRWTTMHRSECGAQLPDEKNETFLRLMIFNKLFLNRVELTFDEEDLLLGLIHSNGLSQAVTTFISGLSSHWVSKNDELDGVELLTPKLCKSYEKFLREMIKEEGNLEAGVQAFISKLTTYFLNVQSRSPHHYVQDIGKLSKRSVDNVLRGSSRGVENMTADRWMVQEHKKLLLQLIQTNRLGSADEIFVRELSSYLSRVESPTSAQYIKDLASLDRDCMAALIERRLEMGRVDLITPHLRQCYIELGVTNDHFREMKGKLQVIRDRINKDNEPDDYTNAHLAVEWLEGVKIERAQHNSNYQTFKTKLKEALKDYISECDATPEQRAYTLLDWMLAEQNQQSYKFKRACKSYTKALRSGCVIDKGTWVKTALQFFGSSGIINDQIRSHPKEQFEQLARELIDASTTGIQARHEVDGAVEAFLHCQPATTYKSQTVFKWLQTHDFLWRECAEDLVELRGGQRQAIQHNIDGLRTGINLFLSLSGLMRPHNRKGRDEFLAMLAKVVENENAVA